MPSKRQTIEDQILHTILLADPSKQNYHRYKEQFQKMDDAQFSAWMNMIKTGQTKLYLYAPNMHTTIRINDLLAAAKFVGVELFERIRLWDSTDNRYFTTPYKYLVLKLPVRRVKQYLMSKMSVPDSDKTINPLTGQTTKPDKGSSISMTEAQTLDSKGLHKSLTELTNIRGGNQTAYANFKSNLEEHGQSSINELDMQRGVKSAEVTRAYLESMHIKSNL